MALTHKYLCILQNHEVKNEFKVVFGLEVPPGFRCEQMNILSGGTYSSQALYPQMKFHGK